MEQHWIDLAAKGLSILKDHKILYLALEMRVGKTPTSLMIAQDYGAKNILLVTTKKSIEGIEGFHESLGHATVIDVINYEQLHNYEGHPDLVIVDEAHKCGAFPKPSERTRFLKIICEGKPVVYLSGTPTPESFSQLYHQFWISSFSPWIGHKNFYSWANSGYVKIGKKYFSGQAINDYSAAIQERIQEETDHLFVSYTQEEAGFKQVIEEEVLLVRMQPSTYFLADKLIKNRIHTGKGGEVVLADTSVKLQSKLHQIYSGTVITESSPSGITSIVFDKSKVSMISDVFADKKIAIFYKFKAEEIMIRGHLGRPITTDAKAFNNNPGLVFISQIISGREGINLDTADALIFLNIDFSATSYIQARARLQSKARTMPAKVYWVFAENGIELKIYNTVKNKMDYTNAHFKKDFGISNPKKDDSPTRKVGLDGQQGDQLQQSRVA